MLRYNCTVDDDSPDFSFPKRFQHGAFLSKASFSSPQFLCIFMENECESGLVNMMCSWRKKKCSRLVHRSTGLAGSEILDASIIGEVLSDDNLLEY